MSYGHEILLKNSKINMESDKKNKLGKNQYIDFLSIFFTFRNFWIFDADPIFFSRFFCDFWIPRQKLNQHGANRPIICILGFQKRVFLKKINFRINFSTFFGRF
jgi:hypothetical protein